MSLDATELVLSKFLDMQRQDMHRKNRLKINGKNVGHFVWSATRKLELQYKHVLHDHA